MEWDIAKTRFRKNTFHFSIIAMLMTLSLFSDLAMKLINFTSIHPSLKFTREDEEGDKPAFLDINISRRGPPLLRSIYRKKVLTGLYIRYDSFSPRHHKLATIKSISIKSQADRYTITTPGRIGQFTNNIYSHQHYQQIYRTSNGSEKYRDRRIRNQNRVPVTIHWPNELGIRTQDK